MDPYTTRGGLRFYTFPHFNKTGLVTHGFTTRWGGKSSGPYAGLNTAFGVGDKVENVRANRSLACTALSINPAHLVAGKQVHGDRIAVVGLQERGRGALSGEETGPVADALVTGTPGVPLASYYADCVPVFLLDPVNKAVALAHAGWKGTALKIGSKTVQLMKNVFNTDPGRCLAGIGPAIGPCCYEVGPEVVEVFNNVFTSQAGLVRPSSPGKMRLDLWEANRRVLLSAGLDERNIYVAGVCTSCHNDLFFSYRAQNGVAGRMASLLMLK
jgi:hypothetical protein